MKFWTRYFKTSDDGLTAVVDAMREAELTERMPLPWELTRAIRHAYQQGWITDLVAVEQIHRATRCRLSDEQAQRILHHGEVSSEG